MRWREKEVKSGNLIIRVDKTDSNIGTVTLRKILHGLRWCWWWDLRQNEERERESVYVCVWWRRWLWGTIQSLCSSVCMCVCVSGNSSLTMTQGGLKRTDGWCHLLSCALHIICVLYNHNYNLDKYMRCEM